MHAPKLHPAFHRKDSSNLPVFKFWVFFLNTLYSRQENFTSSFPLYLSLFFHRMFNYISSCLIISLSLNLDSRLFLLNTQFCFFLFFTLMWCDWSSVHFLSIWRVIWSVSFFYLGHNKMVLFLLKIIFIGLTYVYSKFYFKLCI